MFFYANYDYSLFDQHHQHIEANTFYLYSLFIGYINRMFNFKFFV